MAYTVIYLPAHEVFTNVNTFCSNLENVMFQRNYYFCFVSGVNQVQVYLVVTGPMFMGE